MTPTAPINPEFADLFVKETLNPYRACIQGLANEPCTRITSYNVCYTKLLRTSGSISPARMIALATG